MICVYTMLNFSKLIVLLLTTIENICMQFFLSTMYVNVVRDQQRHIIEINKKIRSLQNNGFGKFSSNFPNLYVFFAHHL